jgi:hypothetical protein
MRARGLAGCRLCGVYDRDSMKMATPKPEQRERKPSTQKPLPVREDTWALGLLKLAIIDRP